MSDNETYQLEYEGAQFYEEHFTSSIFSRWAKLMVNQLDLNETDNLLDIACGTGIVAITAFSNYNIPISGLDINPGMLKVARQKNDGIDWINSSAENLPFPDKSFSKICCQFGCMFFQDRPKAIQEMQRVKKEGGKIRISVWDEIQYNEGYQALMKIVKEVAGDKSAAVLNSPFNLGNLDTIKNMLTESGLSNFKIETLQAEVAFPSIEAWVDCDVKASPIIKYITPEQYAVLKSTAKQQLSKYEADDGTVRFKMSAHFIAIE